MKPIFDLLWPRGLRSAGDLFDLVAQEDWMVLAITDAVEE